MKCPSTYMKNFESWSAKWMCMDMGRPHYTIMCSWKKFPKNDFVIFIYNVDAIMIIGHDIEKIECLKDELNPFLWRSWDQRFLVIERIESGYPK